MLLPVRHKSISLGLVLFLLLLLVGEVLVSQQLVVSLVIILIVELPIVLISFQHLELLV